MLKCLSPFINMMETIIPLLEDIKRFILSAIEITQKYTPDEVLIPGTWLFSKIGLSIQGPFSFLLAAYISYAAWITAIRIIYICLRPFGLYNPAFHHLLTIPGWRSIYRFLESYHRWKEEVFSKSKGHSAKTASLLSNLAQTYKRGRIFMGRAKAFGFGIIQPVGCKSEGHRVLVGSARSGKSNHLCTEVALWKGNVFMLDPKATLTKILWRRLGSGGNGIAGKCGNFQALDPFGMVADTLPSAGFNIFSELKWIAERFGEDAVVRFAAKTAEALVRMDTTDKKYFPLSARDFVMALVLFIYVYFPQEEQNLITLRKLLTEGLTDEADSDQDSFEALIEVMRQCEAYDGIIAQKAAALAGGSETGRGDILATAREATNFLDFPEIRSISKESTFCLADLKEGNLSLSIVLPAGDMQGPLSGFVRLLTVLSMDLFEIIQGRMKHGCLFVLEELPAVGHIEAIERAAPLMASMGIALLAIIQDIEGLKRAYPKSWGGFLGNSDVLSCTGVAHEETASYLENVLGKKTRKVKLGGGFFSRKPPHTVEREYNVLTADQIKRLLAKRRGNILSIKSGGRPMILKQSPYWKELPVFYYEPDPDFKERPLRAFTRAIIRKVTTLLSRTKKKTGEQESTPLPPPTAAMPLDLQNKPFYLN